MRYLLDTNVVIWALLRDERLKPAAMTILRDPGHELFCSVASVWEIGIKLSAGKLRLPDDFFQALAANSVQFLPITIEHAYAVRSLPRLHGDPFDRMLIVQAMMEDLTIMTHDKQISAYSVSTLLV